MSICFKSSVCFRTLSVCVWPLTTSKFSGLTWKVNGSSLREKEMRREKKESSEETNEEGHSPPCAKVLSVCK